MKTITGIPYHIVYRVPYHVLYHGPNYILRWRIVSRPYTNLLLFRSSFPSISGGRLQTIPEIPYTLHCTMSCTMSHSLYHVPNHGPYPILRWSIISRPSTDMPLFLSPLSSISGGRVHTVTEVPYHVPYHVLYHVPYYVPYYGPYHMLRWSIFGGPYSNITYFCRRFCRSRAGEYRLLRR